MSLVKKMRKSKTKIMVGLLTDFNGTVRIGNHSLPKEKGKAHELIGYLPQKVSFQEWRTVEHALDTFAKLSGLEDEDNIEGRISEVLDLVNLSESRNRKIEELSGGTIQRLGMAQALVHEPKFLVLDEPLSGLDPASRYRVKEVIKDLAKGGTTVFFSSHILSDVEDVATKIGIIDLGRILDVGTLEGLKSNFSRTDQIKVILSKYPEDFGEIESINGVENIDRPTPDKLVVNLEDGIDLDEVSHEIISELMKLDCKIRSFSPVSPDLDELYLKYLGAEEKE